MDRKRTPGAPDLADQDPARETPAMDDGESGFGQNGMSEDDIRMRAYEIWEAEDRPDGGHQRHWLQAEQELRGRSSQEV